MRRQKHGRSRRRFPIALVLLLAFAAFHYLAPMVQTSLPLQTQKAPVLTEARKIHILYGDRSGGGHLYGMKKPCKSEFPQSWSKDVIVQQVQGAAANDNLAWKQQSNGYKTAEVQTNGVVLRLVVDPAAGEIVTAYPLNTKRNPCPVRK